MQSRDLRGRLNKRIALEPGTAERTSKWHRRHVMQKLRVGSLAELVPLAEKPNLVADQDPPLPGSR